jgi:RNA polymerase sigma-70 factor (ECF subfamily)
MPVSELVVGVIEGRIDFAVLQRRFERGVYKVMITLLKDAAEAEEQTQRVFVRVFERLRDFDPRLSSFGTWLYRIAYNMAVSRYRARKRAPVSVEEMLESQELSVAGPEEIYEARVRRAKLYKAFRKLSPIQRDAFLSFHIQKLPWKVFAARNNCSERAGQYHCRAAERKLRESL